MDSAELRAVQQPLKDAYRENPEKAVVTPARDSPEPVLEAMRHHRSDE